MSDETPDMTPELAQAVLARKADDEMEERVKKNLNFVQWNRATMASFRALNTRNPLAANVLMMLVEKMNRQNALMVSQATLCKMCGCGRTSLYAAVKLLKQERWIQTVKVGQNNAYLVNAQVFWQDSRDKKHAEVVFNATIVASREEQDPQDLAEQSQPDYKLRTFPVLDQKDRLIPGPEELPPPDQTDLDLT